MVPYFLTTIQIKQKVSSIANNKECFTQSKHVEKNAVHGGTKRGIALFVIALTNIKFEAFNIKNIGLCKLFPSTATLKNTSVKEITNCTQKCSLGPRFIPFVLVA